MLQDPRLSRTDILSLKYSGSRENLERCHGMVGEQEGGSVCPQTRYIGFPESPPSSCSSTCSGAAPRAMEPLLVIFARAQILVFLLRTVWDNDGVLVEAERDLSSNKSSSALLGKSTSVPI